MKLLPLLGMFGLLGSKFMMGVAIVFTQNFTYLEASLVSLLGGMLGIFLFSYFGVALQALWRKVFPQKQGKRVFTKTNRLIVKVKRSFGLAGVAFLTPCILTVPVGAIIANHMYKNKPKVFAYMLVSFAFWSFLLCGLYYSFGFDIRGLLAS